MFKKLYLFAVALGLITAVSAGQADALHREIKLGSEKLVKVEIEFGAGKIRIGKAGSEVLFAGDMEYCADSLRPVIEYSKQRDIGHLKLSIKKEEIYWKDLIHWKDSKSLWNLMFTGKIPLDFEIQMGANKGNFDFSGLKVRRLKIETGASKTILRFSRRNKVRMEELRLTAGAAKLRGEGLGNANFKQMHFEAGVGTYTLDFRGDLRHKARADISLGLGHLTLLIPEEIGTKIDASQLTLCTFSANGFKKRGRIYTNRNYGKTKAELIIYLEGGLGDINIESVSNNGGD